MTFEEILDQTIALLQRRGRVSYRALKLQFQLDDEYLETLKEELIDVHEVAVDQDGKMLVWTGRVETTAESVSAAMGSAQSPVTQQDHAAHIASPSMEPRTPEAERRQLTVLFCDLVGSTALAARLDPEELREVVRAYQETCAKVIARFEGHIAQYLGDGLLVYFGYPLAHEDDAPRAVRAGLGIVEAVGQLTTRLARERGVHLAVRLGIHTGLVVVGDVGGGTRQEQLALGETPNLAACLQGLAAPNTVVISAATVPLLGGFFACQALGPHLLKGFAQPLEVYQVLYESMARSRLEAAGRTGLTPLVGREQEVALLRERWAQVKEGLGQVVLLSGEAGIGKSRLVQVVKDEMIGATALRIEYRCSPYHQHSALYPVIAHLEQVLAFHQDDTPEDRVRKLEEALRPSPLPLAEVVPLLAALLSVPLPDSYPPLILTPQRQRQKTLEALLTWLLVLTERQPLLLVVEDLHWIDPSTLEFLTRLVEQGPTAGLLTLLTCRPEFQSPWGLRTHLTPIALQRLPQPQVEVMIARVTGGKALPPDVLQHVVTKTDGVPLFVEELTKTVLESGLLQEIQGRYVLTGPIPPLAIPTTLHDSLMARLDRLAPVKAVAQLGAVLGRTFAYELLQAVTPLDEAPLQQALARLVDAELLYQRGVLPQATYTFKHALIRDAAYESLLRSTRQQYHQRIAQALAERFPETAKTQPELLAHHYTEAGLSEQAIKSWQQAGQRAVARSANLEAIGHYTRGLEILKTLPDAPARAQQELRFQLALGAPYLAVKGYGAPEVERVYSRARELCQQIGETPEIFRALWGLRTMHYLRAELRTALELGKQLLHLAQRQQDTSQLVEAHRTLGNTLFNSGDLSLARTHFAQALAFYDPTQDRSHIFLYGQDSRGGCLAYDAWALWLLGYPQQALERSHEALTWAENVAHPYGIAFVLYHIVQVHHSRRETRATRQQAEAAIALSTEHGFAQFLALGFIMRGSALAQEQHEEGIRVLSQGLALYQATGAELNQPYHLALLAEAYSTMERAEEGLRVLSEALALVDKNGEHLYEAELHRLQGEFVLALFVDNQIEAETYFHQALDVARRQEAKSLELRAAMSLARLWQHQGKLEEARALLAPIYGWFTEGFDTADLQEAKALLGELG